MSFIRELKRRNVIRMAMPHARCSQAAAAKTCVQHGRDTFLTSIKIASYAYVIDSKE